MQESLRSMLVWPTVTLILKIINLYMYSRNEKMEMNCLGHLKII